LQNNEINLNDEKKPHIFLDKGSANLSWSVLANIPNWFKSNCKSNEDQTKLQDESRDS
jgi:hypothetical protein